MATMSTPIQELNGKQSNAAAPQDPEILSVLNEMEQEMAAARQHHPPPQRVAPVPSHAPPPVHIPSLPMSMKSRSYLEPELLQKAGIVALIALVIFYPETLRIVYGKLPAYEHLFESYDTLIRAIIFGLIVYVLLWKFNM